MTKSRDATHFATDGPAPRRYDGDTAAARVRVAVFVRSEYSNALVGDGVPQFEISVQLTLRPLYRVTAYTSSSSRLSYFGICVILCLLALESSSSAAHILCTDGTAYCAAATVVTAMGSRPHWPSVTCAAACVSDTARRLLAPCETMGVR